MFSHFKHLLHRLFPELRASDKTTDSRLRVLPAVTSQVYHEPTKPNQWINVSEWVAHRKETFGSYSGLALKIESEARKLNSEQLGISGELVERLLLSPALIPVQFWGSELGWKSEKRYSKWKGMVDKYDIKVSPGNIELLIKCKLNPRDWVPHPYAPPVWCLLSFDDFSRYMFDSREAYSLAREWQSENAKHLRTKVAARLSLPADSCATSLRLGEPSYAWIALSLNRSLKSIIIKRVWKGESQLVELVRGEFPDTLREHSPRWLGGQRLDIFIPSRNVAIEYHGEQHFSAVTFFGGRKGLRSTQTRDTRKRMACKAAGVALIEWPYTTPITRENLRRALEGVGVKL